MVGVTGFMISEQFLADRATRSMIIYQHDNVLYVSVCPSICLWRCSLWLNDRAYIILQQKCLNKCVGIPTFIGT